MTVKDAAIRLEVSPSLVYGLIASGKLRCCRIGNGRGVLRISDEQLAVYLVGAEPKLPVATVPAPASSPKLKHIRLS